MTAGLGAPLLVLVAAVCPACAPQTRMVTVAGHSMRVQTAGPDRGTNARPVVVFESGAATGLEAWADVLAEVTQFARAVAYDRAGIGLSEPDGQPPTPRHVAGLVYVDPTDLRSKEQEMEYLKGSGYTAEQARLHVDEVRERMAGYVRSRTGPYRAEMEVIQAIESSYSAEFRRLPPVPPIPVSVLVSGRFDPAMWAQRPCEPRACPERWLQFRTKWLEALAGNMGAGAVTIATGSGHEIQRDDPGLVVSAIRRALSAAKDTSP